MNIDDLVKKIKGEYECISYMELNRILKENRCAKQFDFIADSLIEQGVRVCPTKNG